MVANKKHEKVSAASFILREQRACLIYFSHTHKTMNYSLISEEEVLVLKFLSCQCPPICDTSSPRDEIVMF